MACEAIEGNYQLICQITFFLEACTWFVLGVETAFCPSKLMSAMGYPSRPAEDGPPSGGPPAESEVVKVKYSSDDPLALANFLTSADIRLVRAEYVWSLCEAQKLLPRRQEAEDQSFESRSGQETALVTHQEVQEWGEGKTEALLCSISHCWETREHPDPCGYQLDIIASAAWWYALAYYPAPVWLFIDYTSLFQYKREENSREAESFKKAMNAMHLMYCHEFTLTLAVRSLTPPELWQKKLEDGHKVLIYHEKSGTIKEVPLEELTRNLVEYLLRGWCQAELQWSSARSDSTAHQRIDRDEEKRYFRAVMPLQPELFKEKMNSLKFTHRSDTEAVFHLQQAVFMEKVTTCNRATFAHVDTQGSRDLVQALPYYKCMQSFTLINFECDNETFMQLCELLEHRLKENALTELVIRFAEKNRYQEELIVKTVAKVLPVNRSLTRLNLDVGYGLALPLESSCQALAAALGTNATLYDVDLMPEGGWQSAENMRGLKRADIENPEWRQLWERRRDTTPGQVDAFLKLEQLLQERQAAARSSSVKEVTPSRALRPPAINEKLVKHLQQNSAQCTDWLLHMGSLNLEDAGAQAVAQMLDMNSRAREIYLGYNNIGDAGAVALAEAIKINKTLTEIDLTVNKIGDAGAAALAEAIKINKTVQKILRDWILIE